MEALSSISLVCCSSGDHIVVRASEIVVFSEGDILYYLAQFRELPDVAGFTQKTSALSSSKSIGAARILSDEQL
jgi:hypothetical protein